MSDQDQLNGDATQLDLGHSQLRRVPVGFRHVNLGKSTNGEAAAAAAEGRARDGIMQNRVEQLSGDPDEDADPGTDADAPPVTAFRHVNLGRSTNGEGPSESKTRSTGVSGGGIGGISLGATGFRRINLGRSVSGDATKEGGSKAADTATEAAPTAAAAGAVPAPPKNIPSGGGHSRTSSTDSDPYSSPEVYYAPQQEARIAKLSRSRTFSIVDKMYPEQMLGTQQIRRRLSKDEQLKPKKLLINVDDTLDRLLHAEDTDRNFQITVEDEGPKVIGLGTVNSWGYNTKEIRGTYQLSNLLQELTLAKRFGRKVIVLDEERLTENPVSRLHRFISQEFWNCLTRRADESTIEFVARDPKSKEKAEDGKNIIRIYIPHDDDEQFEFYSKVSKDRPEIHLDVVRLPEHITPQYVYSINKKPGILALAMTHVEDRDNPGKKKLQGVPYVVPGGRFNELYGWDSYMESLGLLLDCRIDLAKGMVINFCYEINHYGKILNANRSYYLCRSQPPFLTDMALQVYDAMIKRGGWEAEEEQKNKQFLSMAFKAAISEYKQVWTSEPRLDPKTGLSRYRPEGVGIPPETESSHFEHLLVPYCKKYRVSFEEFQRMYNEGLVEEPGLDEYFLHDRAVRESGHDTSYRLEGVCADLATIDLNSLLYKYEIDIAKVIQKHFNGKLEMDDGTIETPEIWEQRAEKRKKTVNELMWSEENGMYFDYDTKYQKRSEYESATTFWAMWAGMASAEQAARLINETLPKFEEGGGLASGTKKSRGEIGINRPTRQWDYPYGWAPQQILAWVGLMKYGYSREAERLVYRWLYMITRAFVDYNGVVVEKYNVTCPTKPHDVKAEYGNQGLEFKGVATEGFGWVNASYQIGLSLLSPRAKRVLGALTPPDQFVKSMTAGEKKLHTLRDQKQRQEKEAGLFDSQTTIPDRCPTP